MRRLTVSLIVLVLFAALPAAAGKIGFVDAERAAGEIEEGKSKIAELQAWQGPYQANLDRLRAQVLALRDQLEKQQGSASPEAIAEIERNQVAAVRAFEDARRDYERELDVKQRELLDDISKKIREIAVEYAQANGYDAVFLVGTVPMVYIAESADLTDTIIELYDQRHPVSPQ
jgi:outer membrane protein